MNNPINILFPPKCILCRKLLPQGANTGVCDLCAKKLEYLRGPRCQVCGMPLKSQYALPRCRDCAKGRPFVKCFVPFRYHGELRHAIYRLKFSQQPGCFRFLAREIVREMEGFRPDVITFVPQSRKSYLKKGFNQTQLLAKEIGRLLKIPVENTLIHSSHGRQQVGLSRAQRMQNARTLYSPRKKKLSGTYMIVDDIVTTGATLDACCTLLKRMGCQRVYAAAVAKNIL